MQKYLFLTAILGISFLVSAQNIVIYDSLGNNVSGQTITHYGNVNESLVKFHFKVENIFTDSLDVKLKRTEIGKVTGTQNYFCWSICYNPVNSGSKPTWVDIGTVKMKPDSLYENFSAYYIPNGVEGVAGFHYVLYDVNNSSDSAFVDIFFDMTTGINENHAYDKTFIFPNPNDGNFAIQVTDISEFNDCEVKIYNILGEEVSSQKIKTSKSEIRNIPPGIYFCSLKEKNRTVLTKKFMVTH